MIRAEFQGRLGNQMLQNVGISILAKKFDLKVERYANIPGQEKLGLSLYQGTRSFQEFEKVLDVDLPGIFSNQKSFEKGLQVEGGFQVKDFVLQNRNEILSHFNLQTFSEKGDQDVFVHVRLDDVAHANPGFEYYAHSIRKLNKNNVYVSSDQPDHPIVKKILSEFGAKIVSADPLSIINFAKDFKHLVLSKGTFSWWCGVLSNSKSVYYPVGDLVWYGDIFVYDDWTPVDISQFLFKSEKLTWIPQQIDSKKFKRGIIAGSFDLIHPGYIRMFKEAKDVCETLIIALQDDPTLDRPQKCKPVHSWEERKEILSSLKFVDEIVRYCTEKELFYMLQELQYDVRILGADYCGKTFNGDSLGKPVYFCNRDHVYSLTDLKKKIAVSMK